MCNKLWFLYIPLIITMTVFDIILRLIDCRVTELRPYHFGNLICKHDFVGIVSLYIPVIISQRCGFQHCCYSKCMWLFVCWFHQKREINPACYHKWTPWSNKLPRDCGHDTPNCFVGTVSVQYVCVYVYLYLNNNKQLHGITQQML